MAHPSDFKQEVSVLKTPDEIRSWLAQASLSGRAAPKVLEPAAARYAEGWDEDLVKHLAYDCNCASLVAKNKHLPDSLGAVLANLCLRQVEDWFLRKKKGEEPLDEARALTALARRGILDVRGAQGQKIEQLLGEGHRHGDTERELALSLLHSPKTSAKTLAKLSLRMVHTEAELFVKHPNSNLEIWSNLLLWDWDEKRLSQLLEHEPARKHPVIRRAIWGYGALRSSALLAGLLHDDISSETRALWQDLLRIHPDKAVRWLDAASTETLSRLAREDLLPLLSSTRAEYRLSAIAAQGKIAPPAPEQHSSRER